MANLQTVQTPSNERASRYVQDADAIIATLKALRDQRCTLSLSFEKHNRQFKARLLDVYEDCFLIENITPRDGLELLKKGATFTVAARSVAMFAFIAETKISEAGEERGLPYFTVPLPNNVLVQKRRRSERYRLPLQAQTQDSFMRMLPTPEKSVRGKILDISAGGCRIETSTEGAAALIEGTPIDTCQLQISSMLSLESEAVVRHKKPVPERSIVECGVELTKMSIRDRRRLEHFIEALAKTSEAV